MVSAVSHFQDNKAVHREDLDLFFSIREDTDEDLTLFRNLLVSALIFQTKLLKKEYEKVIQIAKEQGCEWNSGDSLDYIYCTFPTRLFFDKRGRVTFGGYHE